MSGRLLQLASAALLGGVLGACVDPAASASIPEVQDVALRLDSDGLPIVRAGLWEIVQQEDEGPRKVSRQCLTRAFHGAADGLLSDDEPLSGCQRDRSVQEGRLQVVSTCEMGKGARQVSDFVYRGNPVEYELTAKVTTSLADGTVGVFTGEGRGRWLGDCPGDMVPGDRLEFDG